ncbi:MAG: alanine dehydrogenase [Candidatus Aenigmarchaeota archaeon]|nr:alanine dehydrogenase [Candidatus Aenigmarchaeota archaeon]
MNIGTVKEIKNNETRVGITPDNAKKLTESGHTVLIEKDAGKEAGYEDDAYIFKGATIATKEEIFRTSDIIVKVKEPMPEEYPYLELMKGKTLYTFLHLAAADKQLTLELLKNRITGIAYETVTDENNRLPLLSPMSEIAGVLATQYGAQYLQKKYNGKGITLGNITGAPQTHVVIIGGGTAGAKAAETSGGLGSNVTLLELNETRIEQLKEKFKTRENITIIKSTPDTLRDTVKTADLLIGAVLVPGNIAPTVITEDMVRSMEKGTVLIDIAIDQGGCIWASRPTSHDDPTYEIDGKIYCCITNMPGQVPHQSTKALTSATIKYLKIMADTGIHELITQDKNFRNGINTIDGRLTNKAVAEALELEYTPVEEVLSIDRPENINTY